MSWIPICSAWCASPNSLGLLLPLPFDGETAVPCALSHQLSLSFTCFIFFFPCSLLLSTQLHTQLCLSWPELTINTGSLKPQFCSSVGKTPSYWAAGQRDLAFPVASWAPCTLVSLVVFFKTGTIKKKPSWTVLSSYWKTKFLAPVTHPKWKSSQLASLPIPQTAALQKVLCVCMCLSERHLHSFSVHPATEHKSTLTLLEKWKDGISQEPACAGGGGGEHAQQEGSWLFFIHIGFFPCRV